MINIRWYAAPGQILSENPLVAAVSADLDGQDLGEMDIVWRPEMPCVLAVLTDTPA